jgi:hypothetical protein
MAILIVEGNKKTRVIIDYRDMYKVHPEAYHWCDIYGKVNLNTGETPKEFLKKSISLGPMVAPKLWGFFNTARYFIANYLRSLGHLSVSTRYFLNGYRWQLGRPSLEDYSHRQSDKDYIFFDSTLWVTNLTAAATNEWRARYIRICKSLDLKFEGGLNVYKDHPENAKFKDVLTDKVVSQDEYMEGIKRSVTVFNTPSTHRGHGWKLGEFLALGKAMVSVAIENDLPEKLEHGKNIHFIQNEEEMRDAINKIRSDDAYRKKLEQGALKFYNTYLAPEPIVKRLLNIG